MSADVDAVVVSVVVVEKPWHWSRNNLVIAGVDLTDAAAATAAAAAAAAAAVFVAAVVAAVVAAAATDVNVAGNVSAV